MRSSSQRMARERGHEHASSNSQKWQMVHGDCLHVMQQLLESHGPGAVDMVFADPPYFLSNNGVSCQSGKMVSVNKGSWDRSEGVERDHDFHLKWLTLCQQLLKSDGTIWVSGTHHVILSVGYAMQRLGFKILNDVIWEKPNPPPNLGCRNFTHATETLLWAARDTKSKHLFNYKLMKEENGGKQMKNVWRYTAASRGEKELGKHPTQKPLALMERLIKASTRPGDLVVDPFAGSGTTGVACLLSDRCFIGIEKDEEYFALAGRRLAETET
jgi:site-specific DNA-methyltransferase (adenine-specific)